jgi:hypothetical protein
MDQNCAEMEKITDQLECIPHWERSKDFEKFLKVQSAHLENLKIVFLRMSDADTLAQEGCALIPLAGKQIGLF